MDIKAIKIKTFLKKSESIYKNIIITATRARQIIDDRYQEISIEEDIEDSDQLDALLEDIDHDVAKPISQSFCFTNLVNCSIFLGTVGSG